MTNAEKFESAYASFAPRPDDNQDGIPYYAASAGLRAAWGLEFYNTQNHVVHQAACYCAKLEKGERYAMALSTIQGLAERASAPPGPYLEWDHSLPPQEPTEGDARAEFVRQFKEKFPGKRSNSKFANEYWAKLKDKAMEIVREKYVLYKAKYDKKSDAVEKRNQIRRDEWQEKADKISAFKSAVNAIVQAG